MKADPQILILLDENNDISLLRLVSIHKIYIYN